MRRVPRKVQMTNLIYYLLVLYADMCAGVVGLVGSIIKKARQCTNGLS